MRNWCLSLVFITRIRVVLPVCGLFDLSLSQDLRLLCQLKWGVSKSSTVEYWMRDPVICLKKLMDILRIFGLDIRCSIRNSNPRFPNTCHNRYHLILLSFIYYSIVQMFKCRTFINDISSPVYSQAQFLFFPVSERPSFTPIYSKTVV